MSNRDTPVTASFGNQLNSTAPGASQTIIAGKQGAPLAVKNITTSQFMDEVIGASRKLPVLVDFWAPWCEPCKQLAPVLEKVVGERRGQVKLVKMDIEAHPEVAGQMRIQSIPAVVAFKNGQPADAFMGVRSEGEIRAFIDKLAGKDEGAENLEAAIGEGEELLQAGDLAGAANLFGSILQAVPDNTAALAGLGMVHLANGNVELARQALEAIDAEERTTPRAQSLAAAIELHEQAGDLGDLKGLAEKVEQQPDDHQARFDLALGLNGAGKRQEAADQLLEILRRDRQWQDDGARKQLLQFFEAWGPGDPATLQARRQLSAILFA